MYLHATSSDCVAISTVMYVRSASDGGCSAGWPESETAQYRVERGECNGGDETGGGDERCRMLCRDDCVQERVMYMYSGSNQEEDVEGRVGSVRRAEQ